MKNIYWDRDGSIRPYRKSHTLLTANNFLKRGGEGRGGKGRRQK